MDEFPVFSTVYYASIEQNKFMLPYLICSRDERGPELMAHILAPLRTEKDLPQVRAVRGRWSFAISLFGVR